MPTGVYVVPDDVGADLPAEFVADVAAAAHGPLLPPPPLPPSSPSETDRAYLRELEPFAAVYAAAGRPEPLRRRILPPRAVERDQIPRARARHRERLPRRRQLILRQALGTAANMTFLSPLRPRTYVDRTRAAATTLATTFATSATLRGSSSCRRTCAATP